MLNLSKSTAALTPPPPSGPTVSPPVIRPEKFEDFPCFRETFCVYFPDARANARLRGFGALLFEMVLETWSLWPSHPEGDFPAEIMAAVADLRHVQGALGAWCGPDFTAATQYEIRLAGVGLDVAQTIGAAADRLEVELKSWHIGGVS